MPNVSVSLAKSIRNNNVILVLLPIIIHYYHHCVSTAVKLWTFVFATNCVFRSFCADRMRVCLEVVGHSMTMQQANGLGLQEYKVKT